MAVAVVAEFADSEASWTELIDAECCALERKSLSLRLVGYSLVFDSLGAAAVAVAPCVLGSEHLEEPVADAERTAPDDEGFVAVVAWSVVAAFAVAV